MTLKAESKYPTRRAYVVKVRADATYGTLCGRLENFVTGQQREFATGQELLDSLASDLLDSSPTPPADQLPPSTKESES